MFPPFFPYKNRPAFIQGSDFTPWIPAGAASDDAGMSGISEVGPPGDKWPTPESENNKKPMGCTKNH